MSSFVSVSSVGVCVAKSGLMGGGWGGCGWAGGRRLQMSLLLVAFRKYAYEAGLAIECTTDVGWGDPCVVPCGGDGDAHEVCRKVSCAMVETADSGDGAPGDLVEASAACRRRGS